MAGVAEITVWRSGARGDGVGSSAKLCPSLRRPRRTPAPRCRRATACRGAGGRARRGESPTTSTPRSLRRAAAAGGTPAVDRPAPGPAARDHSGASPPRPSRVGTRTRNRTRDPRLFPTSPAKRCRGGSANACLPCRSPPADQSRPLRRARDGLLLDHGRLLVAQRLEPLDQPGSRAQREPPRHRGGVSASLIPDEQPARASGARRRLQGRERSRAVPAIRCSACPSGERRRHTSARSSAGNRCAANDARPAARFASVATASCGSSVTPAPSATICERRQARGAELELVDLRAGYTASACSRKQCPSSRSRTFSSRSPEIRADSCAPSCACPAGAARERRVVADDLVPRRRRSASSAKAARRRSSPAASFATSTYVLSLDPQQREFGYAPQQRAGCTGSGRRDRRNDEADRARESGSVELGEVRQVVDPRARRAAATICFARRGEQVAVASKRRVPSASSSWAICALSDGQTRQRQAVCSLSCARRHGHRVRSCRGRTACSELQALSQ